LDNARYLWKRTPKAYKTDEYKALWDVAKAMSKKEYHAIYSSFSSRKWSEANAVHVKILSDTFRFKTWKLISTAYSSISAEKAASLVGETKEDTIKKAKGYNWTVEGDYILPKPIPTPKVQSVGIEQLNQLTEYVIWLERKN